ncbi:V4R domain-containing protein [Thioflexithrix psekupsensis]|uniref:4-vinyl reductase 4VR domain-containing protein n=1 Tax=Thioflexithrix psekupsensis TaxID=1570016 RepID=A0A251X6C9_9GAMM|nr:V4R domain-containing protein [Thioflexithrix psekupsensis]OUD12487.1 hypothetical protein TPSD3_15410 [Thioflexithrix psekupsensis]
MHTHHIDIILKVEQISGVLGPAAAVVMQYGLKYQKHTVHQDPNTGFSQLILETEGGHVDPAPLIQQLQGLLGVKEVLDVVIQPKEESLVVDLNLDQEGRRLLELIAQTWPNKLVEVTQKYEDSFHRSEQEAKVTLLGEAVGRRLALRHAQLREVKNIKEGLQKMVIPLLNNVAQCQIKDTDLEITVSLFSRRFSNTMDLVFGSEVPKCFFLTGFIQGVLNQAPFIPNVTVTEPQCRAVGDKVCLFKVNVAA